MLHKADDLIGTKIHALDGEMGHIDDLYFDERQWTVRYLIVQTGSWLSKEHIMLSPASVRDIEWDRNAVLVDLTQDQIKNSPILEMEMPVTREQEMELAAHFQWPNYWGDSTGPVDSALDSVGFFGSTIPGMGVGPMSPPSSNVPDEVVSDIYSTGISDPVELGRDVANTPEGVTAADMIQSAQAGGVGSGLRQVKEVTGYQVAASDGSIGNVSDFLLDDENWQIQSLVIDTTKWWPGGEVMIPTHLVSGINWSQSQLHVKATRDEIKNSPVYKP